MQQPQDQPQELQFRDLGRKAAGPNRHVYVAGALALTEPGPAGAGIVVTDDHGRVLAQRAYYLGQATRAEANAQALLTAARLAYYGSLKAPIFRLDDAVLGDAVSRQFPLPGKAAEAMRALFDLLRQLPGYQVQVIPTSANLARSAALAPLVEWLPERSRRAEELKIHPVGDHVYEVESESQPGQSYRVTLRPPGAPGDGDPIQCECADWIYRGVPCKHLLAVARQTGELEALFRDRPTQRGATA